MTDSETVEALAHTFILYIQNDLSADTCREIDRRNATPEYNGCCASHDFCDANMILVEAFGTVMKRPPCDEDDDFNMSAHDHWLWNSTTTRAREIGFTNN